MDINHIQNYGESYQMFQIKNISVDKNDQILLRIKPMFDDQTVHIIGPFIVG